MHPHKCKIQRKLTTSQDIWSLTLFAKQSLGSPMRICGTVEYSLKNSDWVDNRGNNRVISKIYQEPLMCQPVLLSSDQPLTEIALFPCLNRWGY